MFVSPGDSLARLLTSVLEQLSNLGYNEPYIATSDMVKKLHKFNHMCGTMRWTLKLTNKETRLNFYKTVSYTHLDVYKRQIHNNAVQARERQESLTDDIQ